MTSWSPRRSRRPPERTGGDTRVRTLVIGSRGSRLALWQAEWARTRIERAGAAVRIEIIHTSGDRFLDRAPAAMGGKGVFVKGIEEALLAGAVDLAVPS